MIHTRLINKSSNTHQKTILQKYSRSNNLLDRYIRNIRAMNKGTAYEYYTRLRNFQNFVINDCNSTLDILVARIREGQKDPYDILSGYIIYLQNTSNISPRTIKGRVTTAKNFLEYY